MTGPCPEFECMKRCSFGYEKNPKDGCATCECRENPCLVILVYFITVFFNKYRQSSED